MNPGLEIPLIAVVTAVACALPGAFIVLQRQGLIADAIGHTVLLGIVLAFLAGAPLGSPLLVVGATLAGLATVALVQWFRQHRFIASDAAIGLVFPTLFAIAVILVSRYAGNVHLDTDAVLLGMLELAPLERFVVAGHDLGPRALGIMGLLLLLNLAVILLLHKELRVATFDPDLALALGYSPILIHWTLMTLVSITAVGAFEVVGGVLVVAFMVAPPATALLLARRLSLVLALSAGIAAVGALLGIALARMLDANLAGSMATVLAALFVIALLFAPGRGIVATARHRKAVRREFHVEMLLVHLASHSGTQAESDECHASHLTDHLGWDQRTAREAIESARDQGLILQTPDGLLRLSAAGIQKALEGAAR
jgi:manganese/zinc/iron transport system permease protein